MQSHKNHPILSLLPPPPLITVETAFHTSSWFHPPQSVSGRCSHSYSCVSCFSLIIGPLSWSPVHHCVLWPFLEKPSLDPLIPLVLNFSCFNQPFVPVITRMALVCITYILPESKVNSWASVTHSLGVWHIWPPPPWRSFFSGFLWCHLPWISSCSPLLLHFPSPPPALNGRWLKVLSLGLLSSLSLTLVMGLSHCCGFMVFIGCLTNYRSLSLTEISPLRSRLIHLTA